MVDKKVDEFQAVLDHLLTVRTPSVQPKTLEIGNGLKVDVYPPTRAQSERIRKASYNQEAKQLNVHAMHVAIALECVFHHQTDRKVFGPEHKETLDNLGHSGTWLDDIAETSAALVDEARMLGKASGPTQPSASVSESQSDSAA